MEPDLIPVQLGENWRAFAQSVTDSSARRLAVVAPPGIGVRALLERRISICVEHGGLVVVVSPMRVIADQWAMRLRDSAHAVTAVDGPLDYMAAIAAAPERRPQGVLTVTSALVTAKTDVEPFASLSPDLLVLDGGMLVGDGSTSRALSSLAQRSLSVICVVDLGLPFEPGGFDQVLKIDLRDLLADGGHEPIVREVRPETDLRDALIRRQSLQILGWQDGDDAGASLAELHSALSRELAAMDTNPDEDSRVLSGRELIESLMDRIESSDNDPRLALLIDVVRDAFTDGRPCMIFVARISDGAYIAQALRADGIEASVVNSTIEVGHRHEIFAGFGPGMTLIVGTRLDVSSAIPARTRLVWWSSPSDALLVRDLARAISGDDVELYAMTPGVLERVLQLFEGDGI